VVRRTKEEAQATRNRLLDAAETLFHAHGVSRTSLQDIAAEAGTTRDSIAVEIDWCDRPSSIARSNAPLCGSPVPTFRIAEMPAACARWMTSSRSASNSEPSMCACESTNIRSVIRALLQTRAVRHVFRERSDHRPAFFAVRRRDHHSLRLIAA